MQPSVSHHVGKAATNEDAYVVQAQLLSNDRFLSCPFDKCQLAEIAVFIDEDALRRHLRKCHIKRRRD